MLTAIVWLCLLWINIRCKRCRTFSDQGSGGVFLGSKVPLTSQCLVYSFGHLVETTGKETHYNSHMYVLY